MHQYHAFEDGQNKFLFLPSFKQLFLIPDYEYAVLKDTSLDDKQSAIISSYEKKLNPEDFGFRTEIGNREYCLFLCIANTCNSWCTYCFAHNGDYGKSRALMPLNIAKKSIDFFTISSPICPRP